MKAQQQSPACQQLVDRSNDLIYDNRDYSTALTQLLKADSCYRQENTPPPAGYHYLIAKCYFMEYQDSLSAYHYQMAVQKFQQVQDSAGIAKALNSWGNVVAATGLYDSAIALFDQSLYFTAGEDQDLAQAIAFNNKGNALTNLARYDEALAALYASNKLYVKIKASDKRLSSSYLNIGRLLDILGESQKAIEAYRTSMHLKKNIQDSIGVARVLNNIGVIYKNQQLLDSALWYYQEARHYLQHAKLLDIKWDITLNLGNIYALQHQYPKSEEELKQALLLAKTLKNKAKIGESYYALSNLDLVKGDTIPAITTLEKALPFVQSTKSFEDRKAVYENLSSGYFSLGKLQQAYRYRLMRDTMKDSIYQISKAEAIEEMMAKYEAEKKDQEIAFLSQESELQQAIIQRNTLLIIGLVILLLLAIAIFYFLRFKTIQRFQIAFHQQESQLKEAQLRAVVQSQEQEKKRFASDLHDGMGQLISVLQLNIESMKTKGSVKEMSTLHQNSTTLLKEAHQEIRDIAFNLMPRTLTEQGLIAALKALANRVNQSNTIHVHFYADEANIQASEIHQISIYRILQELMSNIIKYSQAQNVYVNVNIWENTLDISIEDDGEGYDLGEFMNSEGNGWRTINTRLELIDGEIEIDTQKGQKGSCITLFFDLTANSVLNNVQPKMMA